MHSPKTNIQISSSWLLLLQLILVVAVVSSCGNKAKAKRLKDLEELKVYVQTQKDSIDYSAERNWDKLNREFERRKAELENQLDQMDDKARETYNNAIRDWDNVQIEYSRNVHEREQVARMDTLRSTIVLNGVSPDYSDLSAKDLVKAYEHFVRTVKANKDVYTSEEWTVVNVNYKALNSRKREMEKEIPEGDSKKILQLQLEYTGIKVINRPIPDTPEVI